MTPEWSQWSDREIGRKCGISHHTVALLRPSGQIAQIAQGEEMKEEVVNQSAKNDRIISQKTRDTELLRAAREALARRPNATQRSIAEEVGCSRPIKIVLAMKNIDC